MLSLMLFLALQAAPAASDDILVIGRQLQGVSVALGPDAEGRTHCALRGSSGNARIDGQLCRHAPRRDAPGTADFDICFRERKAAMLEQFRRGWEERGA